MPEYFYISIPLFNDRLEREIDEWLHVMKYDAVPENYHSPYMSQVAEKLSILKMTAAERASYSYYRKRLHNDRDELEAAEARGEAKGRKEGRNEEKIAIAKNLLEQNIDIDLISKATGLATDEIKKLKS